MKKKTRPKSGAAAKSPSVTLAGDLALQPSDRRALNRADLVDAQAISGRRGAPKARAKAAALRREVEAGIARRIEDRALAASIAQQVALEAARFGEPVDQVERSGAIRLKSRDGLKTLHVSGGLTDAQLLAGQAYRQCYEAQGAGLRGARYGDEPKGGKGNAAAAELQRAYLLARLAQFDRAICAACPKGHALLIVRQVAGEGAPLTSRSDSGAARRSKLAGLIKGLTAIAAALPVSPRTKPLRIGAT